LGWTMNGASYFATFEKMIKNTQLTFGLLTKNHCRINNPKQVF